MEFVNVMPDQMNAYKMFLDRGLIKDASITQEFIPRGEEDKTEDPVLFVKFEHEGNLITLYSTRYYAATDYGRAAALEESQFYSVELAKPANTNKVTQSSIFGSSQKPQTVTKEVEYKASKNTILTSDGIYYHPQGWAHDKDFLRKSRALAHRGLRWFNEAVKAELDTLGFVKILDLSQYGEAPVPSLYNHLISEGAYVVEPLECKHLDTFNGAHNYKASAVLVDNGITYSFLKHDKEYSEEFNIDLVWIKKRIELDRIHLSPEQFDIHFGESREQSYTALCDIISYNNKIYVPSKRNESRADLDEFSDLKMKAALNGLTEEVVKEIEAAGYKRVL